MKQHGGGEVEVAGWRGEVGADAGRRPGKGRAKATAAAPPAEVRALEALAAARANLAVVEATGAEPEDRRAMAAAFLAHNLERADRWAGLLPAAPLADELRVVAARAHQLGVVPTRAAARSGAAGPPGPP